MSKDYSDKLRGVMSNQSNDDDKEASLTLEKTIELLKMK